MEPSGTVRRVLRSQRVFNDDNTEKWFAYSLLHIEFKNISHFFSPPYEIPQLSIHHLSVCVVKALVAENVSLHNLSLAIKLIIAKMTQQWFFGFFSNDKILEISLNYLKNGQAALLEMLVFVFRKLFLKMQGTLLTTESFFQNITSDDFADFSYLKQT